MKLKYVFEKRSCIFFMFIAIRSLWVNSILLGKWFIF